MRSRAMLLSAALIVIAPPVSAQDRDIERCAAPIGTIAVVEPEDHVIHALRRYHLESPTSLIRMMIQQSNCFRVVDRGAGMQTMQRERELARSGDLQQNANIGGGQMAAADYVLTPNVLFSEGNAGGVGAAVGGLVGRRLGVAAGGLKFKEAQTGMLVSDVRTSVQIASAEGHAKTADIRFAAFGFLGGALGAVGGYTNTNEGKVIAASFVDNYNNIVVAIRNDPSLAAGGAQPKAGAVYSDGDVVAPKIDNINLLAEPNDAARAVATLSKTDELVFLGEVRDGFLRVQAASGAGWVKAVLVAKQ